MSKNPGRTGFYNDDETSTTDDADVGGESSSFKEYLMDNFLNGDNSIKWSDLALASIGGIITAVWTGVITIQQAAAAVIDAGLQPIEDAAQEGGADFAQAITTAADAWGVMDAGPFSLAVNAVALLAAMGIIAWVGSSVWGE